MGWEKDLRAFWGLHLVSGRQRKQRGASNVQLGINLQRWGRLVILPNALHESLNVLWRSRLLGRMERVKQMGESEKR